MHDVWDDGHEYFLPFIQQYSANCFAPLYCGPARSRDWKISKIEILRKADYTVKLERLINRCGKGSTAEDDPHIENKHLLHDHQYCCGHQSECCVCVCESGMFSSDS